jgi:predicted MFS family arabinose efflux permease
VRYLRREQPLKDTRRKTLLLLAICAFASAASMRICDPLLPVLARDFDTSLAAAAATTTGFAIAYGATQLFFGPLGDRIGRLPVIVTAIFIAAAASVACAMAPTLQVLVTARIATGAFAAAAIPLSLAWIGDNVAFGERQPVLARYLIGQMLGMTAGQIGGGVLADWIGWRFAFWGLAVLFTGAALMLYRSMRQELADRRAAAAAGAAGQPGGAAGAAAAGGFLHQSRILFSDRWAVTVIGTVTLEGTLLFGAVALVASHLQQTFAVSPSVAGTVSALFGLGGLFYALNAGKLIARLRAPGLCRLGGGFIAAAMVVLLVQPVWQPAVVATLMAGLGYYMLHNTLQTQATQLSVEARGAALAWFASGLWLGQGIGVSLAAAAAERFGFGSVFAVTAVGLGVLGATFANALKARERRLHAAAKPVA